MKLQDVDRAFCEKRSQQGASRSRLAEVVAQSMRGLDQSNDQARALDLLRSHKSVVAGTGQQVGLFGGPMYTLCKIQSAVAAAAVVTERSGHTCIPVFWLEDNDHDALEAMHTHLLVGTGSIGRRGTACNGVAQPRCHRASGTGRSAFGIPCSTVALSE